jgi:hypothetical protein
MEALAVAIVETDRKPCEVMGGRIRSAGHRGVPRVCASVRRDTGLFPRVSACSLAVRSLSDEKDGTDFSRLELSQDQLEGRRGAAMGVARAVEVRIVQEDHVAGAEILGCPAGNSLWSCKPPPILAPARPEQRFEPGGPRCLQTGCAVDAVGGAVPGHGRSRRVLDRPATPLQINFHLRRRQPQLQPVAVAVESHRMTATDDLADELGTPPHLLADHEERRSVSRAREDLEYRRRPLWVRTVVEGERHAHCFGERTGKAEGTGGILVDRSKQPAEHPRDDRE